jgi:alpha-D-xyloside xylohydrolase
VPLFRVHGQFPFREIYNIAPENHAAYQSMLFYNKLRYRLMPYLYSIAGMTYHNDYTLMRGLVMDFPKDTAVYNISDQYMFGPSLLINPVYNYKQRTKELYLPAGQGWYDLYSGKYAEGGKKITVAAPYERMPLFVKAGSIIPFGPELQYTAEKKADTITLYIYTGKDGSFTLYEDEGTNYNYEKGAFSTISFDYNEAAKTVSIGNRKGSFPGMLEQRIFNIIFITPNQPQPLDFEKQSNKKIQYTGKSLSIKM